MKEVNGKLLDVAFSQYGIAEIVGSKHNPEVMKYYHDIGHKWVDNDELPWCAAFANWVIKRAGYEDTGKLNARSFLTLGVEVGVPSSGDLVIFWRKGRNSPYGHIAFFIRETDTHVYVLGGNQGNKVCIKAYPKYRILGYRTLK